jgi:predicted PhzF superfamily epimerase YddE/YHI9
VTQEFDLMKYTFQSVGVFGSAPFGGNQLAARPDAAGIGAGLFARPWV